MIFNRGAKTALIFCALLFASLSGWCCQCPPTTLSRAETEKYEIIFRGQVQTVKACGERPGEAVFKVEELYKGNAAETFTVQFDCEHECAVGFRTGEEWIIYSRYRQMNLALMDWCSRSRRFIQKEKEDFYTVNYGNDFMTEVNFLRSELGLHRLLLPAEDQSGNRNRLPGTTQSVVLILVSITAMVVFYILFKRFFR